MLSRLPETSALPFSVKAIFQIQSVCPVRVAIEPSKVELAGQGFLGSQHFQRAATFARLVSGVRQLHLGGVETALGEVALDFRFRCSFSRPLPLPRHTREADQKNQHCQSR